MSKNKKKIFFTLFLILVLSIAGCSANNPGTETKDQVPSSTQDTKTETTEPIKLEPLKLDITITYDGVEYPQAGNDAQKTIEEYTNTSLNITAYPSSALHELLPTMIASGELPMVVGFGGSQLAQTYMLNAMDSGVFWDLTDYIDNYSNISSVSDITYKSYTRNGRIYGLPKERGLVRNAFGYRYDWIQNLGLKEPTTVYELFDLMVAFTKDDPDGNNKSDTYGTCTNPLFPFAVYLGAPNAWRYDNGEMIQMCFTDEYLEALDMVRELYSIGALHPEFSILSRSQYEALWTEGKAGTYYNVENFSQFKMTEPNADVHASGVFSSKKGTFTPAGTGHNGILAISTTAVKDKDTLERILQFFDDLGDQEMCNSLALGKEGVHYNLVDGTAVPIEEMQDDLNQKIYMPYAAPLAVCYPNIRTIPVKRTYLQDRATNILKENLQFAVPNPILGLTSETNSEVGSDIGTIIADAETQYIMGKITKEQYLKAIELWKERGGRQIAEEFAQAYEKREGN